ncbi:PhzF family phenazine biosynthesis protein [Alteriqipengyuania sp. WL0013]|uniref:PhzF family phenazine biosynthesis protein n=1 Tax=Alteriqipengyuania sp. WL0013 TaxID=3110773 RepID=UPI002CF0B56C|nr:PhzF family phenazine biosynthesis protein [Alteriqipengyuania sp. WL0013]MEB3416278.1 PhzF family phenazine biosynthesis protein [Alteriqipengyuania sp. WL0013]
MKLPYTHVDAFADRPFTGNQAAVMPLESWLDDEVLQAIAAENMFAETAFVIPDASGETDYELRWFTPTEEVRLCGHATLASGHVLLAQSDAEWVTFRTRLAGNLEVRRVDAGYEVGLPLIETAPQPWDEALRLLGVEPQEVWRNDTRYNVFLYDSAETVRALDPDLRGLGALGNDQFICTAPGEETDVLSRVFVPGGGVDEDSVTGSAHAVLTHFWTERLGRGHFTAHQASARGGTLTCRRDGATAWLGGNCVTVVEGSFYLEG